MERLLILDVLTMLGSSHVISRYSQKRGKHLQKLMLKPD